jgi:hypothetical protein
MTLGRNQNEIVKTFKNIVKSIDAQGLLREDTNQIKTRIKGIDVEIKVHITNGVVRSLDGYIGHSARIWQNSITWF